MSGMATGSPAFQKALCRATWALPLGPSHPHTPQRPDHALSAPLPLTGLLMWKHQSKLKKRLSDLSGQAFSHCAILIFFLHSNNDRLHPLRACCMPGAAVSTLRVTEFSPLPEVLFSASVMRKLRQREGARLAPNAALAPPALQRGRLRPCSRARERSPAARRSPAVSIAGAGGGRASRELHGSCPGASIPHASVAHPHSAPRAAPGRPAVQHRPSPRPRERARPPPPSAHSAPLALCIFPQKE